ncbi:sigma 54-interacting transcriptional regulator [Neomoorella mulderi]|uniref:Propionate catabolism operon regulatory protein n=1 Tax=Moorella mulderi DSM 14980 TaxID=1122241 RepID=A0A151AVS8_9FIRM|nr:sigma 54-interacting transcriptional regulator [Moorella mulderi]KYH31756.1 propionate catabolism operon regulatory protein [Moorella mulderi DSM 14980]
MKPRVVAISYGKLTDIIKGMKSVYESIVELHVIDSQLEEALNIARRLEREEEVEVFVTGNSNARLLNNNLETPIVAINAGASTVLELVYQAAKAYGEPVAVMSFREPISKLKALLQIVKVQAEEFIFNDSSDAEECIKTLQSRGFQVVVGAGRVCKLAQKYNFPFVFRYPRETVREALDIAVQLAVSRWHDKLKNNQLRVILDNIQDGVIAVDRSDMVNLFNTSAEKILGIARGVAVGRNVTDVLPGEKYHEAKELKKPEINCVKRLNHNELVFNYIPIIEKNQVEGMVVTFNNLTHLQESEYEIRRKYRNKGFVARASFDDIIGESTSIKQAKKFAERFANSEGTVLITGESGTGKELFAQSIHLASKRSNGPFVPINCAALPENLLESELFGYEEGAFTGAKKGGKAGLFELAHGGTLFLDEIGEISLNLQTRLLRALQEREVMRVGGSRVIPVDVRVIAATNRNLKQAIKEGRMREDFYYRINVLNLHIPPLRARLEDIVLLSKHFMLKLFNKMELPARSQRAILNYLKIVEPKLKKYSWPGNVRELENFLERFVIMVLNEEKLEPNEILYLAEKLLDVEVDISTSQDLIENKGNSTSVEEREYILRVLKESGGKKKLAAERLGISRVTLWRRLKDFKVI